MTSEILDFDFLNQSAIDVDGHLIRVSPIEYIQQKISLDERKKTASAVRDLVPDMQIESALKDKYAKMLKSDAPQALRAQKGPAGGSQGIKKFSFRERTSRSKRY